MQKTVRKPTSKRGRLLLLLPVLAFALAAVSAMAQTAPLAGTAIGNQASATYTDASNVSRTATSNLVQTIVQQVASFTLTADGAKTAAPGAQAVYPHTLKNTGNGQDSFPLALATGGAFTHTATAIFADANGDGVPDNNSNLVGSSVPLASGATFKFVVVGTVPSSATAGQVATLAVTANSTFDGALPAQTNTDSSTVTANAVINVTKALSQSSGASPSGPYTVTLTYTNNGNTAASNVELTDALPAGMTYVASSGRWSVTGASVLTDSTGDLQPAAGTPRVDYSFAAGTVTAVVDQVGAGQSGMMTFQVTIDSGLAPGAINNTANYRYNDGAAVVGPFSTNAASFTVLQVASVVLRDTGNPLTDADAILNDVTLVSSSSQGSVLTFTNILQNNGNGTDSFNITLSGSTFPAGTSFALYKSDGVTPLVDSNGDGVPDTGPVAAGGSYTVIIKATLSPGSTGGPFNVTATATSTVVGAVGAGTSDTTTERLSSVTASTVDITGNAALPGGVGSGAGPEGSAVLSNATNPGFSTTFTLYVNNTSSVADTYNLLGDSDGVFGVANDLPSGWTLSFRASLGADCSTANLGAPITNSGVVNSGSSKLVCAEIFVPNGYPAGTAGMFFRALSPNTGAVDVIHGEVTVNVFRSVSFAPSNSGQIFPGGSVVYTHSLRNNGNVAETISFPGTIAADSLSGNGWTSALYQDNGSTPGVLDATDIMINGSTSFALAVGASRTLLVKVNAPSNAAIGAVDVSNLTAWFNGGVSNVTVADTSAVISGLLRLSKLQALDANCDGVADTAFSAADITAGATPGACILYQITATNQGTADVTSVILSDGTPAYTTYHTGAGGTTPAATTVGSISAPAAGSSGTVSANIGTLAPFQSAVVTFGVRIQP
jgi:trimeric autotransporter adhesin